MPAVLNGKTRIGGLMVAFGLIGVGCGLVPSSDLVFAKAPVAVRERASLPGCGVETIRANADANADADTGANVEGRRCLWSAYQEHRPAEFVATRPTVEGDPITSIYRILPDGSVEVFVDSTRDAWSAKTWLRLTCPQLALDITASAQPAFAPGEGCTETTIH